MLENRRHLRIREITDIRWAILGTDKTGEGKVLNISASGLLLQTDKEYSPSVQGALFIDAYGEEELPFGPKKGKVVWARRLPEGRPGYTCGVEFFKDQSTTKLNRWIDSKTEELSQAANASIMSHYLA